MHTRSEHAAASREGLRAGLGTAQLCSSVVVAVAVLLLTLEQQHCFVAACYSVVIPLCIRVVLMCRSV
jgi:hypothetical protein